MNFLFFTKLGMTNKIQVTCSGQKRCNTDWYKKVDNFTACIEIEWHLETEY